MSTDIEKLMKTWKMELTFEELIKIIGKDNPKAKLFLEAYNTKDKEFKLFVDTVTEQAFLVGKLQGGQEVKDMISEFLKVNFKLDFLDELVLNKEISNKK